ncbi:MAG TPA: glycosyltransferase family 87 protein [Gemmata sp.]
MLRFAPALLLGVLGVYQALVTNNFPDLFIYRAGSEIGLRGESPYDLDRIRHLAEAQFPDPAPKEDSFVRNCGYFLPPLAILVFAPFALVSWSLAKVAWGTVLGLAAAGIATLPDLFRSPNAPREGVVGCIVPFLLVLNPLVLAIVIVGQVTIVSVGCVAVGLWCFSRNRPTLGVVLWALTFVKPHVALPLVPLAWYLGGWRRATALVALVAGLNLIGATVAGGSPLFLRDYLDYLPTGHKAVLYNQAERNSQITSWNRLVVSCGGPLIELTATTTLAGYLVWGGLVLGRCGAAGRKPSAAWACAAAVAGGAVCSQVLAYELLMLAIAVPWVRELFTARRALWAWGALVLLVIQTIPIDSANPVFNFYRPAGALAFALLVLFGPLDPAAPAELKSPP